MNGRGQRAIRPARNADGTERVAPGRNSVNNETQSSGDGALDERVQSTDSEESDTEMESIGSPVNTARALFATDSQLESLHISQEQDESNVSAVLAEVHITPATNQFSFRAMGGFLAAFRDDAEVVIQRPNSAPANDTVVSDNTTPPYNSQHVADNNGHVPTQEANFAQPAALELANQATARTIDDILNNQFSEDIALYDSFSGLETHSGQRAILGCRLFDRIVQHFRLSPQDFVMVDGIQISQSDVSDWMGQCLGTINNWRTLERRRAAFVFRVDHLSQRLPRQVNMRSQLVAFETGKADVSIAKRSSFERYLAVCEASFSS
ncbi:hypothetical protein FRC12_016505 [Ceratobasidium sp. 428]|nr:hypothetical protein FRC12_016505 [Ceratobasidium sp. 428]